MSNLPDGWILSILGEVATWGSGGTPSRTKPEYYGGNIPWIKTGELGQKLIKDAEETITELGLQNSSAKLFKKGSVAIAMYGATIGKTSILGINATTNQACAVGFPIDEAVTSEYLYYYLCSQKEAFVNSGQGGAQPNISQTIIKSWEIPLAPLNEQKRIAEKLDRLLERVDACRAHLDRIPLLLKRFRQSVLAAATSGRLTADWREGNGIEENWKETTLGECGSVSGGLTKNAKRNMLELRKPYLRVANVYANKLELDDIAEIGLTQSEFEKTRLIQNDLLIVEGNGSLEQIGRAAIWNAQIPECAHQNHIIRWRTSGNTLPKFALFWLLSPEGRSFMISVSSSTSGLNTLSISKVSSIPIRLPATEEQAEIVRRVESLFAYGDRLEARYQAARAQVEKLTPALLAKAFRGELVPQDPNDEPASVLLERIRATRAANPKPQRAKRR